MRARDERGKRNTNGTSVRRTESKRTVPTTLQGIFGRGKPGDMTAAEVSVGNELVRRKRAIRSGVRPTLSRRAPHGGKAHFCGERRTRTEKGKTIVQITFCELPQFIGPENLKKLSGEKRVGGYYGCPVFLDFLDTENLSFLRQIVEV